MGLRPVSTTRANTSTSTAAAPARLSARAQASMVVPDVSTSSIRISRRSATRERSATAKAPCTLSALGSGQPDLLQGRLDALERVADDRNAARLRYDFRQRRGLVEAAGPQPPPV